MSNVSASLIKTRLLKCSVAAFLTQDDGSYYWSDGWPVFFTQWGPGEPTNIKDEGCVSMLVSRFFYGTWNDTKCEVAKPYICKITRGSTQVTHSKHLIQPWNLSAELLSFLHFYVTTWPCEQKLCWNWICKRSCSMCLNVISETPPPTPAPGNGKCLPFWIPYGHYCYLVYNSEKGYSWPDSRHYCQEAKAELVSIHSRAEVEFIRNLNYTKKHNIWIGLTRDRNCRWTNWRGYESSYERGLGG